MADRVDALIGGDTNSLRGQLTESDKGKLEAPDNIVSTPTAARAIYFHYRTQHLKRIDLYAKIEGLIAGNPPYNPLDLEKHKLSHIANFNNLDGRSLYERGALAYWNLLNQAQFIARFEIKGLEIEGPQKLEWEQVMARHFDKVVREWQSFYTQVNTLSGQLIKFGVSPCIWPDERDWRWRTVELQRFFVTDQAQSDVDLLTAVCVETPFTVQSLYEIYKHFSKKGNKSDSPWNLDELAALLLYRANTFVKTDNVVLDMMDLQRRLQNGDLSYDALFSDTIRLVSLLYKEYSGKISHYMFDRYFDKGKFLFESKEQYHEMQEAMVIFTASPGEFTIHSNRGLGHKIFSGCQAMMQLDCSIIDAARWSSTPLLRSLSTGSKDFEAIRFYPGVPTNIGTAEFQQNNLGANISQLIGASQYILQKLQYNTANSGDDPGVPDRNLGSVSPSQARMESFKEFGVLKHNIAWFYSQFDVVIRNMAAKMVHSKKGYPGYDESYYWKKCCIDDGVPERLFEGGSESYRLPRHLQVYATRVAGDGSTLALIMGLQELSGTVASFSAKGVKEYQRQLVMATMGVDYVDAFLGDVEPDESTGGASLAGLENIAMRGGESPIFSPDNEQRSHLVTHFALSHDTITRLQQQEITAMDADKVFNVLLPHMSDHIGYIARSPYEAQFLNSIKKEWGQLQQYANLNRKNAASQMQAELRKRKEAEETQQQVLSEEEIKNLQAQGQERRANFKVESQVARADAANKTRADIMREKVQLDAGNKRLEVELNAKAKSLEEKPTGEIRTDLAKLNGTDSAPFNIETS